MRSSWTALPLLLLCSFASARDITDALGTKVQLVDPPKRVVTLMPSLGEMAADLCSNLKTIVGVSEFTDYPPGLKKFTSIGPYQQVSLEKIAALTPDVVFASFNGNSKDQVEHLRELGLAVVVLKTDTVADIPASMRLMGEALGETAKAERLSTRFLAGIEEIKKRSARPGREKKKVVLQIGDNPLVVTGGKTLLNEALELIGAENPYRNAIQSYPRPSIEDVIAKRPDALILVALDGNLAPLKQSALRWRGHIPRVEVILADSLLRPSFRFLEGLALLNKVVWADTL